MATTITYGDALTEQTYRSGVTLSAKLQTFCFNFMGTDDNEAIVLENRTGMKRGDTVKIRFSDVNYDEAPKGRADTIIGAESGTNYYENSLDFRYAAFDGAVENVPSDQNHVSFDLKRGEIQRITRQHAYNFDRSWIYHGTGYTPINSATDYLQSGGNIVVAPDANHQFMSPGASAHTTESAVAGDATAVATTDQIDTAILRLTSRDYSTYPAAPCNTPFGEMYVCLISKEGFKQMRANSSASNFYDLSRAELEGGGSFRGNPLITGEGTIYNNTLILASDFMPAGVNGSAARANCKRAMVFGARAFHAGFAEGFAGDDHLGWSEHLIHRRWSCLSDTVWGINRNIVNGVSWSCVTFTHYSTV